MAQETSVSRSADMDFLGQSFFTHCEKVEMEALIKINKKHEILRCMLQQLDKISAFEPVPILEPLLSLETEHGKWLQNLFDLDLSTSDLGAQRRFISYSKNIAYRIAAVCFDPSR